MLIATPACPRCAHSVAPFGVQAGECAYCRGLASPVDAFVRVGPYEGRFAELVRRFKYGGRDELDALFGDALAGAIGGRDFAGDLDAVAAVPTCWQHAWRRQIYVPDVIARRVARRIGAPLRPLLRRKPGPHQIGLPRSERPKNIRGMFYVTPGAKLGGATILLIDDVATTGATLSECARVLRRAGAARLYAGVLARVGPDRAHLSDI